MAKVQVYVNFNGNCEEAFQFYETVFNAKNSGIIRYSELPYDSNMPALSEDNKNKVLHTSLSINGDTLLMGSDAIEGFGDKITYGNSTYIMLDMATAEEARKFFEPLSKDAQNVEMELGETFFAELFASIQDKYGICWMIHYEGNKKMEHHES